MPNIGEQLVGNLATYVVESALNSDGQNASLFKVSRNGGYTSYLAKFFNRDACVVPGSTGDAERAFKRFKKEAQFLRLFDHQNIVRYVDEYEFFQDPDVCSDKAFIIMEFLIGKAVNDVIRYDSYNASEVLEIAKGAARGLKQIHSQDVTHRDIHPGNIFVSNNVPKIIDFGCAVGAGITRPFDYDEYQRLAGVKHRAPEAIDPSCATPKTDVFSFGVTLLELANEELISDDCSSDYVRTMWISRQIRSLGSQYPPHFASLVREMVTEDPYSRPTSSTVLARLESMYARTASTYTDDYDSYSRPSYTSPPRPSYGYSREPQESSEDLTTWEKWALGIGVVGLGIAAAWLLSDDDDGKTAGADESKEPNDDDPKLLGHDDEDDDDEFDNA